MTPTRAVLGVLVLLLLAMWVSWTAGRLDRLHARVDAAWAGLDAALVRRAAAARALARCLPPEAPQTAALERAAGAALVGGPVQREAVENDLSTALRAALPLLPPPARGPSAQACADAVAELAAAALRVDLARSFHNSAVANARVLRAKRLPRLLPLAGHRVLPQHFDVADAALPELRTRRPHGAAAGVPHPRPDGGPVRPS